MPGSGREVAGKTCEDPRGDFWIFVRGSSREIVNAKCGSSPAQTAGNTRFSACDAHHGNFRENVRCASREFHKNLTAHEMATSQCFSWLFPATPWAVRFSEILAMFLSIRKKPRKKNGKPRKKNGKTSQQKGENLATQNQPRNTKNTSVKSAPSPAQAAHPKAHLATSRGWRH